MAMLCITSIPFLSDTLTTDMSALLAFLFPSFGAVCHNLVPSTHDIPHIVMSTSAPCARD